MYRLYCSTTVLNDAGLLLVVLLERSTSSWCVSAAWSDLTVAGICLTFGAFTNQVEPESVRSLTTWLLALVCVWTVGSLD